MPVSFNPILNSPIFAQEMLSNSVGRLKEHSIKALNFINQSLQNEKIAIPLLVGSNLIFFELTNRIALFITNFLARHHWITSDSSLEPIFAMGTYVGLTTLNLTVLNFALYQSLHFDLSPLVYTILSITTLAARFLYEFR